MKWPSDFITMEADKKKKLLKCEHCDVECTCQASLNIHLRTHSGIKPYSCSLCEKTFSRKANCQRHEESHTSKKKYECGVCRGRYTAKGTLMKHMQFHTGENLLSCHLCSRQFTQTSHLKAHMRIHTGEKPYQCSSCDKKFAIEYELKMHQTVHEGREMTCNICGKIFRHLGSYRGHMIRHRQAKTFKCPICGIDFHANCSLKVHMRIHTGEKPFRCEICNKTFTRNAGLREHSAIHSKEKALQKPDADTDPVNMAKESNSAQHHKLGSHICPFCLKRYANKYSLNQHLKIHADKPIRCVDCDRVFSSENYLRKHRENRACHVKKFSCPFCKNIFIKKVNIIIHVKNTHSLMLEGVEEVVNNTEEYHKCSVCPMHFRNEQSRMWHEACVHKLVDQVESDIVMEQKLHAAAVNADCTTGSEDEDVSQNIRNVMKDVLDGDDCGFSGDSEKDSDPRTLFPENEVFIKEEVTDSNSSSDVPDKVKPEAFDSVASDCEDLHSPEENLIFIKEEVVKDILEVKVDEYDAFE